MRRKTYTARCQRSGDSWAISVPELRGVHTQARRLEKAGAMARGDGPLSGCPFCVRIEPVLPRDLQRKVGRARKVRDEAEVLQREAAKASGEVAVDLVQTAPLTVRDAGRVLGLLHQRITQLLKAASRKGQRSHGHRDAGSQSDRSA